MSGGVLITGVTTPFGHSLVQEIRAHQPGTRILGTGREPAGHPRVPRIADFHYESVDLRRRRGVKTLLHGIATRMGVRSVVFASMHRSSMHRGLGAWRTNVEALRFVLEEAQRMHGLEQVVVRSHAEVYRVDADQPSVFDEEHPIELRNCESESRRDRVEADLMSCAWVARASYPLAILRMSECLAPNMGSQLYALLESPFAARAWGFDPMLNLLSLTDAARAVRLTLSARGRGVFNIPGADTLPLSEVFRRALGQDRILPGPLLRLRAKLERGRGGEFDYGLNLRRLHFSGLPDGRRASKELGYRPSFPLEWEGLAEELGGRVTGGPGLARARKIAV